MDSHAWCHSNGGSEIFANDIHHLGQVWHPTDASPLIIKGASVVALEAHGVYSDLRGEKPSCWNTFMAAES